MTKIVMNVNTRGAKIGDTLDVNPDTAERLIANKQAVGAAEKAKADKAAEKA